MYPHGHLIIQEGYLTFNYPTQEIKEWQKRKKKQSSKVKVLIENFPRSHWMVFIYLSGFCWFAGDGREHNLLIGSIATLHQSQGADSVTKNQSMLVSFYCHNLIQPRITWELQLKNCLGQIGLWGWRGGFPWLSIDVGRPVHSGQHHLLAGGSAKYKKASRAQSENETISSFLPWFRLEFLPWLPFVINCDLVV